MSQHICFDTSNEGSDESCKCADSPEPLLSEYTKKGYKDADSYQNKYGYLACISMNNEWIQAYEPSNINIPFDIF